MKLSTRFRYASRVLAELATHRMDQPLPLREVAQRQQVSVKYLEQIFTSLRCSELVRAVRGSRGGYQLARPASEITLLDVYQAIEGELCLVDCVNSPELCSLSWECPTVDTWIKLQAAIAEVLRNTTIEMLAQNLRTKRESAALNFQI